jgi:hypothetical protein
VPPGRQTAAPGAEIVERHGIAAVALRNIEEQFVAKGKGDSERAFQELLRVLSDAVRAGVDSIELEHEDREWRVYFNFGRPGSHFAASGIGGASIPRELQQGVISEIMRRARRSRGKFTANLLGEDYTVGVTRHMSFDEWVYTLTLKKRRR